MTTYHLRSLLLSAALVLANSVYAVRADDLDLSAFKGKVVLVDFWASWCNPCRQSFAWMNEIQNIEAQRGLVVIAVNVDHDRDAANEFLRRNPASFRVVFDSNGDIASRFNFKDMPTSYLVGRDGKIRFQHDGFYADREPSYSAQVDALLKEAAR